ncbi:MAG: hypothetical protein PHD02_01970 [Bacilli bacterium]|nr:hypothetical protein [Bacilli bacterium]
MKNLYIDFDGVLLDTIDVTYKILGELNIDTKDYEAVGRFYETLDWNHILAITPEINDGIKFLQEIISKDIFDVSILTHVNSLNETIEKVNFIRKYFDGITVIPVPKKISKTKMVNAKDSILVDDYDKNLKEWEEAGGVGILFSKSLKDKGFKVIDRLDQIIDVLSNK